MPISPTRAAIRNEALRRGWKFENLFEKNTYYRITNDKGEQRIGRGSSLGFHDAHGVDIAHDKQLTYQFVESLGIHVPAHAAFATYEDALAFLDTHRTIVIKPRDAEQSKGVTVGITNADMLKRAYEEAEKYSTRGVVGQAQLAGNMYRILIVGDRLVAAAERRAAFVIGDGIHSVKELINIKNQDPRRSMDIDSILKPLSVEVAEQFLGSQIFEGILPEGKMVTVDPIASVSRGGESNNVTGAVSPMLEGMLVRITKELGLGICGYDLMTDNIATLSPSDTLPLVEINSWPGLKHHLFPTGTGPGIDPSPFILDEAFSRSYT